MEKDSLLDDSECSQDDKIGTFEPSFRVPHNAHQHQNLPILSISNTIKRELNVGNFCFDSSSEFENDSNKIQISKSPRKD